MYRLQGALLSSILLLVDATSANAQSVRMGGTIHIEREVEGSTPGKSWNRKFKGDYVYQEEALRTQDGSRAVVELRDKSGVYIGPTTTVRFDRMILDDNNTVRSMTVSAQVGAVRWKSGRAGAFRILTPDAELIPLGTSLDVLVQESRTTVVLREGALRVCTLGSDPVCTTMTQKDDMVIASNGRLDGPRRGGTSSRDFEQRCLLTTGRNCSIQASYSPARPPGGDTPRRSAPERRAERYPPSRGLALQSAKEDTVESEYRIRPRPRVYWEGRRYYPRRPPYYVPRRTYGDYPVVRPVVVGPSYRARYWYYRSSRIYPAPATAPSRIY